VRHRKNAELVIRGTLSLYGEVLTRLARRRGRWEVLGRPDLIEVLPLRGGGGQGGPRGPGRPDAGEGVMKALEAKRRGTLALLAVLFLLAILSALGVSPYAALLPLFLAFFVFLGYAQEVRRVLEEEAAKRLGLTSSPKPELPAIPLLPEGEPKAYGEYRGEVLGRPFRRFGVQVYEARRFGAVGYRFTGVLYEVELPRPFPLSTWPPGAGPPTPGSAGPSFSPSCGFWVSSSPSSPGTSRASPS